MLISGRSWILIQCNLHVISGLVLNKLRYFVVSLLDINRLALVCEDSKDPLSARCVISRELRNSLILKLRILTKYKTTYPWFLWFAMNES